MGLFDGENPFAKLFNYTKTGRYLQNDPTIDPNYNNIPYSNNFLDQSYENIAKRNKEKEALLNSFTNTITTRSGMLNTLRGLRKSPIVQTIIDAYINEGFYSNNKFEVCDATYVGEKDREKRQEIMDKLSERVFIQSALVSILPDMLTLGANIVTPIVDSKRRNGVIELLDNAVLDDILPVYRGQTIEKYYRIANGKPIEENAEKYIYFTLPGEPIRIKIDDPDGRYNLPEYFKFSKSIFLHAIDMIKRLDMLDMANLALALRNILMPVLLSIGVPAGTPIKDVISLTRYYENHIEEIFSGIPNPNNISITNLLQLSSKIKALPQYADGKGALSILDINSQKTPNTDQTNQLKRELALYTAVPFYHLSTADGTDNTMDRITTLKQYAKFTKRLNEVQYGTKFGLYQLYLLNFKYSGIEDVSMKDISINFKQIVNTDMLDMMEFLTGSAASLTELYSSASTIASDENSNLEIDQDVLLKICNSIYDNIPNAKGLLRKKQVEEISPVEPEETPTEDEIVDDEGSPEQEITDDQADIINNIPDDISPEDFVDNAEKG